MEHASNAGSICPMENFDLRHSCEMFRGHQRTQPSCKWAATLKFYGEDAILSGLTVLQQLTTRTTAVLPLKQRSKSWVSASFNIYTNHPKTLKQRKTAWTFIFLKPQIYISNFFHLGAKNRPSPRSRDHPRSPNCWRPRNRRSAARIPRPWPRWYNDEHQGWYYQYPLSKYSM